MVIIPSVKCVRTKPEERKKQIEYLIRLYGYARIEPWLTAEERVQYEPK
jgi:hypothetical protein